MLAEELAKVPVKVPVAQVVEPKSPAEEAKALSQAQMNFLNTVYKEEIEPRVNRYLSKDMLAKGDLSILESIERIIKMVLDLTVVSDEQVKAKAHALLKEIHDNIMIKTKQIREMHFDPDRIDISINFIKQQKYANALVAAVENLTAPKPVASVPKALPVPVTHPPVQAKKELPILPIDPILPSPPIDNEKRQPALASTQHKWVHASVPAEARVAKKSQMVVTDSKTSFGKLTVQLQKYTNEDKAKFGIKTIDLSKAQAHEPIITIDMFSKDDQTKKVYLEPTAKDMGVKYSMEKCQNADETHKMIMQIINIAIDNAVPGTAFIFPPEIDNKKLIQDELDNALVKRYGDKYHQGTFVIPDAPIELFVQHPPHG
jgi:hypothetical protein